MKKILFTSESVTEGHPDKICDQISDAILDEILREDPTARVACECVASTGLVLVFGEITTNTYVDVQKVARDTIREIGYDQSHYGFEAETCAVLTAINEQSPDIAMGVDEAYEKKQGADDRYDAIGAGDQGMVFGYACNETPERMPLPITLAHKLAQKLTKVRKGRELDYLRPDGKTQVTVEYEGDVPKRVDTVVVSTQHDEGVDMETMSRDILEKVVKTTIPEELLDGNTKYYVNPTGKFVLGGPVADSGLTGRKIIVDAYGGYGRSGGGAFSGKDPTKVDRSASYAARYVAKNIVASGIADKLEIGLSYAIGVAKPLSIYVDSFGTGAVEDEIIVKIIEDHFDLRPAAIIDQLDLRRPIYKKVAAYGHFGREDLDVPWEKTDKVEILKECLETYR